MSNLQLAQTLLEVQHGRCFICGQPLDLELQKWDVDHIVPRARGGKDTENNFAVTHFHCNRSKSDSDLRVARCMCRYEQIKAEHAESPSRPNLGDFLDAAGGRKFSIRCRLSGECVEYVLAEQSPVVRRVPVHVDSLSNVRYFFAVLPIEYLHYDSRINPRAVGTRVRMLVEEFLAGRPQLHVSLAWMSTNEGSAEVHVFDGQHKAVAQLLLGARSLPVRVFVDPDMDVLLEANTRAGTVLRQVAFDRATQRRLGSQIYWEKIDEFRKATGRSLDDLSFSENDLVAFFRGEHREMRRYVVDDIRATVIHNPQNKLKGYIEFGGKATRKPLSYDAVERTFFSLFIHKNPMGTPLDFRLDVGENPRDLEKSQLLQLMNTFAEEVFIGNYDFDRGTYQVEEAVRKGEEIPLNHLRAVRMGREEILYNILRYVRDCIKRYYLMQGRVIEESDLLQNRFPDVLWEHIRHLLAGFSSLPVFANVDSVVSSAVFGGKQTYDFWKMVFDSGETPSQVRVLAKGLSLDDLLAVSQS